MSPTLNTTILLLVSPAILRVVIQETLEHEGHSVYPAGDLGTAVDKLKLSKAGGQPFRTEVNAYLLRVPHSSIFEGCGF
jgi:hypothetical protein